jgi:hypothetical protein
MQKKDEPKCWEYIIVKQNGHWHHECREIGTWEHVNVTGAATMEFVNSGQAEYERRKKRSNPYCWKPYECLFCNSLLMRQESSTHCPCLQKQFFEVDRKLLMLERLNCRRVQ